MDKIKSFYINKKIFFLLYEKRKLSLFKYNKNLQNKFNINLINYKLFSDRIVIHGEDGISKEYNNNEQLIYEGQYSKGKRNGKGKEYSGEEIIFEGEYLNGKRWNGKGYFNQKIYEIKDGKGTMKEYIKNSNLIFQGLYSSGLKNGKGKEYTICDKSIEIKIEIKFDGEYMYGTKWNGKLVLNNKIYELKNGMIITKFDDENNIKENYLYGEKNGKCEEYNEEGKLTFVGEFLMGKRHGKGREYYNEDRLKFEGEYINGKINGKGKEYNNNGELIFEGDYLDGKKWNGKFINYFLDGLIFDGHYLNGKKNGIGKEYNTNDQKIFEGEYLYDYKIKGKSYIKGILEYEGEFLFNKKWDGKGYNEFGNIIYELNNGNGNVKEYYGGELEFEGEYLNGERNGKGKEYRNGKLIFEGEYLNGERNGKGKEYNYNGEIKFEGEYLNGKKLK